MSRIKVAILGSTGSIGGNAVRLLEAYPEKFAATLLLANSNAALLANQGNRLNAKFLAVRENRADLAALAPERAVEYEKVSEIVCGSEVDVLLCATVGTGSLPLVLRALECGKKVALATKEIMVMAGDLANRAAERGKGAIIPVDSEHSAIFQCLQGRERGEVAKLILTASGGALRNCTREEIAAATLEKVLAHPTWRMGRKVTIDSATLMNKALELVEAGYLFGFPAARIQAVIHPESVVHSLIELVDGTMLAQLSTPDMRFAIGYGLSYPDRLPGAGLEHLDFAKMRSLSFAEVDASRFPSLGFGREALERGGTLPCVMNAANEVAVEKFVRGEIAFPRIWSIVEKTMLAHKVGAQESPERVLEADAWARAFASSV